MSPRRRRFWSILAVLAFVAMCAAIGFSQWWAYNVNVPHYKAAGRVPPGSRNGAP